MAFLCNITVRDGLLNKIFMEREISSIKARTNCFSLRNLSSRITSVLIDFCKSTTFCTCIPGVHMSRLKHASIIHACLFNVSSLTPLQSDPPETGRWGFVTACSVRRALSWAFREGRGAGGGGVRGVMNSPPAPRPAPDLGTLSSLRNDNCVISPCSDHSCRSTRLPLTILSALTDTGYPRPHYPY